MIVAGLMALAATAAMQAQPASASASASARARGASMGVGATVIRPEPRPLVAVRNNSVMIGNAGRFTVSAQGGTARRLDGGTILVTPGPARRVTLTFTY